MKGERLAVPLLLTLGAATALALGAVAARRSAADGDLLAERRAKVESLGVGAKEELLEHQRRFDRLDPDEQRRLRLLHEQMDADPDGPELRRVMQNYYDWLKTLPSYQQAELRDLPREKRVREIKRLLEQQAKAKTPVLAETLRDYRQWKGPLQPGGKKAAWLSPQDVEGVLQWFDRYVNRQGPQFLERLPEPQRQNVARELAKAQDPLRRHEILAGIWVRWQIDNPGKAPLPSDKELAELRARLSPDTRKRLETRPPAEQWRAVSGLIPLFVLQQYAAKRVDGSLPAVSEEELAEFFEKELTARQRDQLLNLPGEEMTRELWRMYLRWKLAKLPRPADRPKAKDRPKARAK